VRAILIPAIHSVGVITGDYVWGMIMSFLALIAGLASIYFILYLATQKTIISDINNREQQQELIFHEQAEHYQRMSAKVEKQN
jgi:hypothetical protein